MGHRGMDQRAGFASGKVTERALVLVPLVFVTAYWAQSEWAILAATLFLPIVLALESAFVRSPHPRAPAFHDACANAPIGAVVLAFGLDDLPVWINRTGSAALSDIKVRISERLRSAIRLDDMLDVGEASFHVLMPRVRNASPDQLSRIANRLQAALSEPILINGAAIYPSFSIGIAARGKGLEPDILKAADLALVDAKTSGGGAIRFYDKDFAKRRTAEAALAEEVERALKSGEIRAYFQPQIATDSGRIIGFEALARWVHPRLGTLSPGQFLDLVEVRGQSERLTEIILGDALRALEIWDRAGFQIPGVGVNFSTDQLRNPNLVERLKWEVDRFGLGPERIAVEVLENVISDRNNDIITRNIRALADHGFAVDLDDFGTGHASIANIRRFQVARLKIDRSFVTAIDRDPEQQAMTGAIIQMADRLGLDCIAEGAETLGEQQKLAELGCRGVQGFGIARPMAFAATSEWIKAQQSRVLPSD